MRRHPARSHGNRTTVSLPSSAWAPRRHRCGPVTRIRPPRTVTSACRSSASPCSWSTSAIRARRSRTGTSGNRTKPACTAPPTYTSLPKSLSSVTRILPSAAARRAAYDRLDRILLPRRRRRDPWRAAIRPAVGLRSGRRGTSPSRHRDGGQRVVRYRRMRVGDARPDVVRLEPRVVVGDFHRHSYRAPGGPPAQPSFRYSNSFRCRLLRNRSG